MYRIIVEIEVTQAGERTSRDCMGHLSRDRMNSVSQKCVLDEGSNTTCAETDGNRIQTICQWIATKTEGLLEGVFWSPYC